LKRQQPEQELRALRVVEVQVGPHEYQNAEEPENETEQRTPRKTLTVGMKRFDPGHEERRGRDHHRGQPA
jgi:hypothetical protein